MITIIEFSFSMPRGSALILSSSDRSNIRIVILLIDYTVSSIISINKYLRAVLIILLIFTRLCSAASLIPFPKYQLSFTASYLVTSTTFESDPVCDIHPCGGYGIRTRDRFTGDLFQGGLLTIRLP